MNCKYDLSVYLFGLVFVYEYTINKFVGHVSKTNSGIEHTYPRTTNRGIYYRKGNFINKKMFDTIDCTFEMTE